MDNVTRAKAIANVAQCPKDCLQVEAFSFAIEAAEEAAHAGQDDQAQLGAAIIAYICACEAMNVAP